MSQREPILFAKRSCRWGIRVGALLLALSWALPSTASASVEVLSCNTAAGNTLGPSPGGEVTTMQWFANEIRTASFPEIAGRDWQVRAFHSDYDYLRTRFSLWRFFLPVPMRYFVEINPQLFDRHAPLDGVCAILAHELIHVRDLSHGNRLRRLGLIRLVSPGYTSRFERLTDLEAIHRGYGAGLSSYRRWIYGNIPPKYEIGRAHV